MNMLARRTLAVCMWQQASLRLCQHWQSVARESDSLRFPVDARLLAELGAALQRGVDGRVRNLWKIDNGWQDILPAAYVHGVWSRWRFIWSGMPGEAVLMIYMIEPKSKYPIEVVNQLWKKIRRNERAGNAKKDPRYTLAMHFVNFLPYLGEGDSKGQVRVGTAEAGPGIPADVVDSLGNGTPCVRLYLWLPPQQSTAWRSLPPLAEMRVPYIAVLFMDDKYSCAVTYPQVHALANCDFLELLQMFTAANNLLRQINNSLNEIYSFRYRGFTTSAEVRDALLANQSNKLDKAERKGWEH